jgi:perosamine synthetase
MIPQHKPSFGSEESKACFDYLSGDGYITEYKITEEFEELLSKYIGCKHCIMTTSGTTALILSLLSLKLSSGDEVIVPNYTMVASINAITSVGAKPVIVDVNASTYTLSLDTIIPYITSKTKVVLHVSLNNRCKDLDKIRDYCEKSEIYLIEDSAQSLGAKYKNKHLGTYGKIGCFSLSTPKIISTGQGGFCVTNDDVLATSMRKIKNFGRNTGGNDVYECVGYNFKYTDLQAVIGLEQMKKLSLRVERMKNIYNIYYANLHDIYEMLPPNYHGWLPWFVDIVCPDENHRKSLSTHLKIMGVGTRYTYPELNKTPMYYSTDMLDNSTKICNRGLFLPSYVSITDDEINCVCNIIRAYSC